MDCSAIGLPNARQQALAGHLQQALRHADVAHAVMDAARPESSLRDLEAPPLSEQNVADGNAYVLKEDFRVSVRRVVEAEHRQLPQHFDARRVPRHEHL